MIKVLVVEDTRLLRGYLVDLLEADPAIQVVGTAESGEAALAQLVELRPDVILMDIHLPGIDGLETTRRIMTSALPVPIVVCTASTHFDDVKSAMRAHEVGALAVLKKPRGLGGADADAEEAALVRTVKLMSEVRVVRRWKHTAVPLRESVATSTRPLPVGGAAHDAAIVVIGASTGGPQAILQILSGLSTAFPVPILVVQHMAPGFTVGFTEWLTATSGMPVQVARAGEAPLPGHVYVAPDGRHLRVGLRGELVSSEDAPENGLRPSIGNLFRSVAECHGRRAIGVLLSGMGRDGAEGLKLMANQGALTIAQDEESCVVFGMPAEAIRLGAAKFVLPPRRISELLLAALQCDAGKEGSHAWRA